MCSCQSDTALDHYHNANDRMSAMAIYRVAKECHEDNMKYIINVNVLFWDRLFMQWNIITYVYFMFICTVLEND